jgi:hypothetical protein
MRVIGRGCINWIHLAQYGDQWKPLVNMLMNLWVHKMLENS